MSRVVLSLTLSEDVAYKARRVVLFRDVAWPSIPPEGAMLIFGLTADGEQPGTSAKIRQVYYEANGTVGVEAELERLGDEYDEVVADAKRDGFMEYAEWSQEGSGRAVNAE